MCAARAVLDAEVEHVEAHFGQGGGSRGTGQAGTYHDDVEAAFVSRVHQLLVGLVIGPFLCDRTFGDFGIRRIHDFNVFYFSFHIESK